MKQIKALCVSLLVATGVLAGTGKLDYFEPSALERADFSGVKEGIEEALARCPDEFATAESFAAPCAGRLRDQILLRVEIGRRLERYVRERHADGAKDLELMAWQGAEELRTLFGYFAAERKRAAARAKLPSPVVLNVKDFGAQGDGKTEDGDAFRKALAAAAAKSAPVVLKVPAGLYLVSPDAAPPPSTVSVRSWRDYDEKGEPTGKARARAWKDCGAGFHLTAHGLSHVVVQGEAGTEIRFTDSTKGGFGFWGCTETFVRNLAISYRDNPSTQGTVVSVETNGVGFVFRRDPGYPDPDEPRFVDAHSNRFTAHVGPEGLVAPGGTGRMGTVERLSADTFRFRPFENMRAEHNWNCRRPGERIVVIARYSEDARGFPIYFQISSFSGVEGVRVFDSPGQNFIFSSCYAMSLLDCEVRVRHGSDDLLASNADGMMGSGPIGPFVDGCRFAHMEDDGFNIGSAVGTVHKVSPDRLKVNDGLDGRSAFQVDAVTGRIKAFLRRGRTWEDVRSPMAPETVSTADLNGGAVKRVDTKTWLRSNSWVGRKGEAKADRIVQIPGTVGAVIRNTYLHDIRGMGVQVHCANMILENIRAEHMQGPAMNVNPLFGWGMLFDVHNILVRNCDFRDCRVGLVVKPGCVQPGVTITQKMIQGVEFVDNRFDIPRGQPAVWAANAQGVRIDGVRFRLVLRRDPAGRTGSATVDSDFADRVRMDATPDGNETIAYHYDAKDAPVRRVEVTIARDVSDGAKRYRMSADIAPGWHLREARFPEYELPLARGGDPSDDRVLLGMSKGGYFENLAAKGEAWRCYCTSPGSACAQFAAAWDDDSGVYFGMEDASGREKTFGFERRQGRLFFSQMEQTWQTNRYEQAYPVVVRELKRTSEPLTWQDFADIYRAWDRMQSWSRTPYLARTDIPAWMKDAPVFTRFSRQWLERPADIRRFVDWWRREIGEMPVVAALWGWEKHGTWWGPDYFPCHPSDETFAATMKDLGARGFHPFAWPSGYNWCKYIGDKGDGTYEIDLRKDWIDPNGAHLVVDHEGKPFHMDAFWLRFGALTTVCGGDRWTHGWWNELTRGLGRRGVDIVQVDQVVGGRIRDCWSAGHGHPSGPGLWKWHAFRDQLETMRTALRSVRADGVVGVEEPCELYNDLVGIQDYRDLETSGDHFASVYSYLFHGYVPMFQSNPFRDEFYSLAHMATDGQMPFFRPDFEELDADRPVLQNGGFENFVCSVRGPIGWDRLIPTRLFEGVDAQKPLWDFSGHNNMGWFGYSVTLDDAVKHGGAVSLKFDPPAKGGRDAGRPMQVSQTIEGLEPGRYVVSAWVRSDEPGSPAGELKFGTRAGGEAGRIVFPASSDWTKVSAEVRVGDHLRLIVWAPPGARFHVDDVQLSREGRDVRAAGDSAYAAFMKKWIALYRGEGRAFLANGFQVKPPALACDAVHVGARREPAVCHAAYENEKGERALVLANATSTSQMVSFQWKGRRKTLTLPPCDLRLVR